jgi:hypothetical protein
MTQPRRLLPYAGAETRKSRITTMNYSTSLAYSPENFFTVSEAAKFAKCSVSTMRNLYHNRPVAKVVLGKILISKPDLQKIIDGGA